MPEGRTVVPPSANLAWALWRAAEARPDATAVEDADGSWTYGRLAGRAGELAIELRELGVQPGDRVGVYMNRSAESAAAYFGTLAAGAVVVNINESLRPRQIEYIVQHSDAGVVLAHEQLLRRLPRPVDTDARFVVPDTVGASPSAAPLRRTGGDLAQIIYTSGSTGMPKGVLLTHASLWAGAQSVTTYLDIRPEDRLASLLPFSFDYGLNQLLCAVYRGAALVVERSPIPQRVVASLRRSEVSVLPAVPPLWLQLLGVDDFRQPIPSLRVMTNTGGRLPVTAVRALRNAHPEAGLFLMYGLTEAFRSTYLPPSMADDRPESIGRAIPGAEIMVLREDGSRCDPGEVGTLVHRGPTVAAGYWKDPDTTARVFRPDPLAPSGRTLPETVVYSGDLVKRDKDGFLYFVGRRDAMIKTLGYRVSPDEVTEVIHASGEVAEAVVVPEPHEERGSVIVAHVVLAADGSVERLTAFCRTELPPYMQPARIEVRQALPRTSSGKFDLQSLRDP